jgi:hypothetical protein
MFLKWTHFLQAFPRILNSLSGRLGHCLKCARSAFFYSLSVWIVVAALDLLPRIPPAIAICATLVASSLTILWLAHISMFAFRSVSKNYVVDSEMRATQSGVSRRAILPIFGQIFFLGVAATALPRLALAAKKFGCCIDSSICKSNQFCDSDKCNCKRQGTG